MRKIPFLARTQPMKSLGLFVYPPSHNFLFLPIKAFFFAPTHGLPWLQIRNCNPLIILNKLIFAKEITGGLFVIGHQNQIFRFQGQCHGRFSARFFLFFVLKLWKPILEFLRPEFFSWSPMTSQNTIPLFLEVCFNLWPSLSHVHILPGRKIFTYSQDIPIE